MRIVSTAYSGMPSARTRIARTACSGRPGAKPASSSRIACSGSGSSASVVVMRWLLPKVGRRSNNSGRVSTTTRMGRFFDHSSRCSMKSSSPVSAHCRSSNTSTIVPCSAMRSKKIRQAAKSASRPPGGAGSTPSRASSAGSTQPRSSASGTYWATVAAMRARVVASSSVSARSARRRIISPSAQKVMPSPYAGERPRCQ